ncbi:MAG: histidine kinase [Prochloraceae cyanobacterium]|nr:histidine kinase [Prochloraceae cyanobacterium]
MLKSDGEQTALDKNTKERMLLKLLLFIDRRYSSQDDIARIKDYLKNLAQEYSFALEIIDIKQQPHLVEHFKLVATPALVKISPLPRQTIAGSDLIAQLEKWWSRWQISIVETAESASDLTETNQESSDLQDNNLGIDSSIAYSAETMKLRDEIFRLEQEKEELSEQLKFKDQILAMLAHDLRSPLTAASIALETLELAENHQDIERVTALKEQLYKQAKRQFQIMNRMIADLLQASKNVKAKLKIEPNSLSLQPLCQESVSQFSKRLQEKSQTLETDLPQDLPTVYADRELVRQVIVNLIDNAIKYTPEGGTIKISLLHRTTQKVQVSVSDTGPGIPEAKKESIFEGHFRLKRDESQEGYGLGLSLCRKIIRAHYGQIWVDSVPNEGSCFHFTLPVAF